MIQIHKMVLCDYRKIQYWLFIAHFDFTALEVFYDENGSPILRGKIIPKKTNQWTNKAFTMKAIPVYQRALPIETNSNVAPRTTILTRGNEYHEPK